MNEVPKIKSTLDICPTKKRSTYHIRGSSWPFSSALQLNLQRRKGKQKNKQHTETEGETEKDWERWRAMPTTTAAKRKKHGRRTWEKTHENTNQMEARQDEQNGRQSVENCVSVSSINFCTSHRDWWWFCCCCWWWWWRQTIIQLRMRLRLKCGWGESQKWRRRRRELKAKTADCRLQLMMRWDELRWDETGRVGTRLRLKMRLGQELKMRFGLRERVGERGRGR